MPAQVHHRPDGLLSIRDQNGKSVFMTTDEYRVATGVTISPLPSGIDQRLYEPGIRHALLRGHDVIDGGPMPWPEGDDMIALAAALAAEIEIKAAAERERVEQENEKRLAAWKQAQAEKSGGAT